MKNCVCLIFVALFIAISRGSCSSEGRPSASAHRIKQSQRQPQPYGPVLEAYVEYMLAHHGYSNCVYFLRISSHSKIKRIVQRKFIQRLGGHVPPVLKAGTRIKYGAGFTDRKTKKPAMIYDVNALTWIGRHQAIVDGGWHNGGLSGIRAKYHIELKAKIWSVSKEMEYAEN